MQSSEKKEKEFVKRFRGKNTHQFWKSKKSYRLRQNSSTSTLLTKACEIRMLLFAGDIAFIAESVKDIIQHNGGICGYERIRIK